MNTNQLTALASAVTVLGALIIGIRYLVRIESAIEALTHHISGVAGDFTRHVDASTAVHESLMKRISEHDTDIAVLQSQTQHLEMNGSEHDRSHRG